MKGLNAPGETLRSHNRTLATCTHPSTAQHTVRSHCRPGIHNTRTHLLRASCSSRQIPLSTCLRHTRSSATSLQANGRQTHTHTQVKPSVLFDALADMGQLMKTRQSNWGTTDSLHGG